MKTFIGTAKLPKEYSESNMAIIIDIPEFKAYNEEEAYQYIIDHIKEHHSLVPYKDCVITYTELEV